MIKFRTIKGEDLYLTLKQDIYSNLALVICDEPGNEVYCGYVFCILENGKLHLYESINIEIGLCLDEDGKIIASLS